jgi:predicted transcriptional regulator
LLKANNTASEDLLNHNAHKRNFTEPAAQMNHSKLTACIAILKSINKAGQLSANEIAFNSKINKNLLKDCLNLLVKQGTVIEHHSTQTYHITQSGKNILKFFKTDNPKKTQNFQTRQILPKRNKNCSIN